MKKLFSIFLIATAVFANAQDSKETANRFFYELNFKPKKGKNLRIRYRGNTNQPSLTQLQPVPDNSNPQYIVNGNPNLKPEFNNNLNIHYNGMDFASMNFIFFGVMADNTINKIANTKAVPNSKGFLSSVSIFEVSFVAFL